MRWSGSGSAATKSVQTRSTVSGASKVPGQAQRRLARRPLDRPTSLMRRRTERGRTAMASRLAPPRSAAERRLAVIDMGSNTFRLVVFRYRPGRIVPARGRDPRRRAPVGGRGARGAAPRRPRARRRTPPASTPPSAPPPAWTPWRRWRRAPCATRPTARRRSPPCRPTARWTCACCRAEEEAWYGYLGAVNSTTLGDGHVLDLGGGSVQVSAGRGPRPRAGRVAPARAPCA